jgi:hypothetical protein
MIAKLLALIPACTVSIASAQVVQSRPVFEEQVGVLPASVDALGIVEDALVTRRWHTICTSPAALSIDALREQAAQHEAQWSEARSQGRVVRVNRSGPSSAQGGFSTRGGGLDVIFDVSLEAPVGDPLSAFALAEAIIESRWSDDATIVIPVTWAPLGNNILGLASITRARISYSSSRAALASGLDADDYVQPWLPTGSSLPVRFTYNSPTTTAVSQIDWPVANYVTCVGSIAAEPGSIRFASDANWDDDPANGISPGTVSLVDVILHEFGHLQGFDSNAEVAGATTITSLDLYRFASIDRSSQTDTNPDSQVDFTSTAREVDNASGGTDLVHAVVGDKRYVLSDGAVNQASHLKQVSFDPSLASGIMQPIIGQGRTFGPAYFYEPDLALLDAIGWDRLGPVTPKANACGTDWNRDQWPDIIWRAKSTLTQQVVSGNTVTCVNDPGQVVSWTFRAGAFTGWQFRPHPAGATLTCAPTSGPPWTLVLAQADVDGDCDADMVWRSPEGAHVLWRMQNGVLNAWSFLPAVDPSWQIVAGGDINADGTGDFLWRNSVSNELGVWYMQNTNVLAWQSLGIQAAPPWTVQMLGDVIPASMQGGNAGADIIWRNSTTGANRAQTITPSGVGTTVNLPNVSGTWRVKGAGDYNGDGTTDLFWFNTGNGTMGIWFMDGTTVSQWQGMPALDATRWE